jgi:ketosteroid isomerase-like protein
MNQRINISEMTTAVFLAMNSRDFTNLEQCIKDEVAFDFPGVGRTEGSRRTLLLLKSILRKYPKLQFTVTETIIQGDRACAVWTNEGVDSNGNPYANSGITLLHFSEGKITFISDYFKDTSFVESSR